VIFLTSALAAPAHAHQAALLWDHGAHSQPSPDERALRHLITITRNEDGVSAFL
jgi:hypothetical protein